MNILHLIHRSLPFHGGAERYVLEHALAASRWGHTSTIATTDAWDVSLFGDRHGARVVPAEETWRDVRIIRFRVTHPPLDPIRRAVLRRLLPGGPDRFFHPNPSIPGLGRWLSRERGFSFVHANAMPFLLYHGYRHASSRACGLASVPHANIGERYRRLSDIRYFAGLQPRILREFLRGGSEFLRGWAVSRHGRSTGADPPLGKRNRSGGVRRSGQEGRQDQARLRRAFRAEHDLPLRGQGSGHLIEACRRLWAHGLDFRLVLAGPVARGFGPELESRLREVPPGRIVLTGYIEKGQRAGIIAEAAVTALPSRLDCFGIILLEAWACGNPVIGAWSGAMPDLVDDGVNGYLVSFGDVETLADRIARLLGDPSSRDAMGRAGREMVLRERTWEKVTDRFYRRVAECRPAGK